MCLCRSITLTLQVVCDGRAQWYTGSCASAPPVDAVGVFLKLQLHLLYGGDQGVKIPNDGTLLQLRHCVHTLVACKESGGSSGRRGSRARINDSAAGY